MTQHPSDDRVDAAMAEAWRTPNASSVVSALHALGYPVPDHWVAEMYREGGAEGPGEGAKRYSTVEEIARGGMGVVLRGHDADLGRDVAMKILRPDKAHSAEILARFIEEAQVGGQLQHPGIVPVYDLGVQANGQAYFTMKLIEGETLSALLAAAAREERTGRRFLRIYEQLCETIAYAHSRGVIHRDLKPQNVMVGAFGEVQVVDWGLAKVVSREGPEERSSVSTDGDQIHTVRSDSQGTGSMVGVVIGTPAYMPREQAIGDIEHIGTPADVFSLGAILCEILTGSPPYLAERGNLVVQAGKADLEDAYARLDACAAHPDLVELCRGCLSRDAKDRPQDAGAVAAAVSAHLAARDEHARRAQIAAARAEIEVREERRRRRLTLALGAAVVLGIAITAGLWWSFEKQDLERLQANTLAVREALAEATRLETQAHAAPSGDLVHWEQARVASERASEMARTVEVGLGIREDARRVAERIAQARADAAATAAQAARDRALHAELEDIRARAWDVREFPHLEAAYGKAFADYGIDVTHSDAETAAAAIRASAIREDLVVALDTWATAKRRQGKAQRAAAEHLHAIASAADASGWRRKVRAAATARDADALRALAEEAGTLTAPEAVQLAGALAEAVNAETGAAFLAKHQSAHTNDFWVNFQLGRWLADEQLGAEDPVRALAYLRAAQALRPDDTETLRHLGLALAGLGREEEALALWRGALAEDPRARLVHVDLLKLLNKRGELEQHVALIEAALASGHGDATDYARLGAALASLLRARAAQAAFAKALEIDPQHMRALRGLGWCRMRQEKPAEAAPYFERYVEHAPGDWRVWGWLATVRRAMGQKPESLAAAKSAVLAGPDVPQNHMHVLMAHVIMGDPDAALEALQGMSERFPKHPQLLRAEVRVAEQLAMKYRHREARRMGEALLAKLEAELPASPQPFTVHDDMATVLAKCLGRIDEAIEQQKLAGKMTALPSGAFLPPTLGDLALFHRMKGDCETAVRHWRAWIAAVPKRRTAAAHQRMAQDLAYLGRLSEAVTALEEARPLIEDPKFRGFCDGLLGAGLLWAGRIEEAERVLADFAETLGEDERAEYGEEQWKADYDAMIRLAPHRAAILAGTHAIEDPLDRQRFAYLCMLAYQYPVAVRRYRSLMQEHPEMVEAPSGFEMGSTLRADAAHCMVYASLGHGAGAERDMALCMEAAGLVRAEMAAKARALATGEPRAKLKVERLMMRFNALRWQLERMDAPTRAAWSKLLEDMEDLYEEARTR